MSEFFRKIKGKFVRYKNIIKYRYPKVFLLLRSYHLFFLILFLLLSVFCVVELYILTKLTLVFFIFDEDYVAILKILLSVSAIVIPIFLAFIVQRFALLRQEQRKELKPLGEMQDKLGLYRRAIDGLTSELLSTANSKQIKIDFKRDYFKMSKDTNFWKEENSLLIFFIRNLYRFCKGYYYQEEFEKGGKFLSYETIENLDDAITEVWDILNREKHYKKVFKPLGIDYKYKNFDDIILCSRRVRFDIPPELMPEDESRILRASFWQELITEAADLLERIKPKYIFLLYRFPERLLNYVISLSFFGIFTPLILLIFNLNKEIEFIVTYYSVIMFIIFLALSFYQTVSVISSPLLREKKKAD